MEDSEIVQKSESFLDLIESERDLDDISPSEMMFLAFKHFDKKLAGNIKDIPPEFQKVITDNFWDLV